MTDLHYDLTYLLESTTITDKDVENMTFSEQAVLDFISTSNIISNTNNPFTTTNIPTIIN